MEAKALKDLIGDPKAVADELARFSRTTRKLSASRPRMIEQYPKQWVALYDDEVRASGSTLPAVLSEIEDQGLPRERVIIRFVDKELQTMIL